MELDWATVWHQKNGECFWTVKLLTKDDSTLWVKCSYRDAVICAEKARFPQA